MNRIKIISSVWILDLHEWTAWVQEIRRDPGCSLPGWIVTAKVVYTSRKGRTGWTNSLMRSMSFARRTPWTVIRKKILPRKTHSPWNVVEEVAASSTCCWGLPTCPNEREVDEWSSQRVRKKRSDRRLTGPMEGAEGQARLSQNALFRRSGLVSWVFVDRLRATK